MPNYEITSPEGKKFRITAPDGATQEQVLAYAQQQFAQQAKPAPSTPDEMGRAAYAMGAAPGMDPLLSGLQGQKQAIENIAGKGLGAIGVNAEAGVTPRDATAPIEAGLNVVSGVAGMPLAGLAGLGQGLWNKVVPERMEGPQAADRVRQVQDALTYKPKSAMGQGLAGAAASPFVALEKGTNYLGEKTTDVTGLPSLGAAIKTAGDLAPALIAGAAGARGPKPVARPKPAPVNPVEAAKTYASARGLDWDALPAAFRAQLTEVSRRAAKLGDLPAQAIERQGLLESLPVPVKGTRGQITRDPVELRNEGNVAATEAGKPIRDIHVAANDALIANLDVLKGKTKGRADSPEQVGSSLQGAARTKLKVQQAAVKKLYAEAEKAGELQGRVSPRALVDAIEASPDKTHFGWVQSWMKEMGVIQEGGLKKLTLKEMEDLRQAAVARAMDGGTEGHYAGKIIAAIDKATDGAGGNAYKAARAARRAVAMEFEEQAGVAKLVDNKSRTDRAVALEDTWQKTVKSGSIEDLSRVKKSLLTGTTETKKAGVQAWRDLRAQTVQHVINEATKSVTRFENGSPNLTAASMEAAIRSIGKEKLAQIFDKKTVAQLEKIMEATRLIKTEPPPIHKGSSTIGNAIALLERAVSHVPVLGTGTVGAIRGIGMLNSLGKGARIVERAKTTPLDDAAR